MSKTIEAPGFTLPGIEDITRRDFLIGGTATLLLGGCGSEERNGESPGATKTVEHAMGSTEVPVSPQRVVTLGGLLIFDPLVQLGVTPVATVTDVNVLSDNADVQKVGGSEAPNLEALAVLEPDLIVGDSSTPEDSYERLAQIAPTVIARSFFADENALDRQRFLADLVGRSDRFERLFSEYEARIEEVSGRLGSGRNSLEVSLLNPYASSDTIYTFREEYVGSVRVLNDLGVSLSRGVRELSPGSSDPSASFELIPELDADVIFALYDPRIEKSEHDEFRTSPLLARTFAYKRDQVFEVSSDPWFGGSLLALHLVLDDIERYLLGREIDTSGDFR